MPTRTYEKVEQGRYAIDVEELDRLAVALGTTAADLVAAAERNMPQTVDLTNGAADTAASDGRRRSGSSEGERPAAQRGSSRGGVVPRTRNRRQRSTRPGSSPEA